MSGMNGTMARRIKLPVPFLVIWILCASLLKTRFAECYPSR